MLTSQLQHYFIGYHNCTNTKPYRHYWWISNFIPDHCYFVNIIYLSTKKSISSKRMIQTSDTNQSKSTKCFWAGHKLYKKFILGYIFSVVNWVPLGDFLIKFGPHLVPFFSESPPTCSKQQKNMWKLTYFLANTSILDIFLSKESKLCQVFDINSLICTYIQLAKGSLNILQF